MRFALVLLLATCSAYLHAAIYEGKAFTFHQPDGAPLQVRLYGTEHSVDIETMDGFAILKDADGWHTYATPAAGGGIAPSAARVGRDAAPDVPQHLRLSPEQRAAIAETRRVALRHDRRGRPDSPALRAAFAANAHAVHGMAAPAYAPPGQTTINDRNGITLLIRFPDRLADANTITRQQVDDYCNANNYTGFGNNGSVKEYFAENSFGRLNYTNTVRNYHTTSRERDYYTNPDPADNTDPVRELIIEALQAADDAGFDFSTCDRNADGIIDGVNVFYAGAIVNNWAEGLWPHMSTIDWTSNDGVATGAYQITNMGNSLELGTFCHENGHMLCWFPDLYDYNYDSRGGAGVFCLMGYGGDGTNPVRVGAYLANSAGWRDPVEMYGSASGTLTVQAENVSLFKYTKPGTPTEYFLIENRNRSSTSRRDAMLPCSGIAIWHIDELGNRDDQRYVKNALHRNYECALVQADGQRHFERNLSPGDTGDLWYAGNPAAGYTGLFVDGTGADPQANDARWWDGTPSNLIAGYFSAPGQSMTFDFGPTTVSLSSATYAVNEGNSGITQARIDVVRSGSRAGAASLSWSVSNGTATLAGLDYNAASGTVSWSSGQIGTKSFYIPIRGDTMPEADETVNISIVANGGVLSDIVAAVLTISNDDGVPPPTGSLEFTAYASSGNEGTGGGSSTLSIPVRRRGGSAGAVSVAWTVTGGTASASTDLAQTSGTLTWADGDSADKSIPLQVVADDLPESDETVIITLGPATGGALAPTPNLHTATILNDDYAVRLVSSGLSVMEPATGARTEFVQVLAIGSINGPFSIDYAVAAGTATPDIDFTTVVPGTLTFDVGSETRFIGIPVFADAVFDDNETLIVTLSNPQDCVLSSPSEATVKIRDAAASLGTGGTETASGSFGSGGGCGAGAIGLLLACGLIGLLRRRH